MVTRAASLLETAPVTHRVDVTTTTTMAMANRVPQKRKLPAPGCFTLRLCVSQFQRIAAFLVVVQRHHVDLEELHCAGHGQERIVRPRRRAGEHGGDHGFVRRVETRRVASADRVVLQVRNRRS